MDIDVLHTDLKKFTYFLAHKVENPDIIGLEFDDIVSELNEELVKAVHYYGDRLNESQMKAVIRRMMDNRISELKYKHFITSRRVGNECVSLEVEIVVRKASDDDPTERIESQHRVMSTREKLSDTAKLVFDAVIRDQNPILRTLLVAGAKRSASAKMYAWQLSDAIGISRRQIRAAMREIKSAYGEVMNGG